VVVTRHSPDTSPQRTPAVGQGDRPANPARAAVDAAVADCVKCPRLVAWRTEAATNAPRAHAGDDYWARGVPGFGDPAARLLIVGLAPAANGANRTGRMFTGDRSGDWLTAALWRCGLANQATSTHASDGLELSGVRITSAVHCAPPGNRPTPAERDACAPYLDAEMAALSDLRVVLVLGAFAHQVVCARTDITPRPRFGHGAEATTPAGVAVVVSYHPSQHNTFTGRLTEAMLDAVVSRAAALAGYWPPVPPRPTSAGTARVRARGGGHPSG